MAKNIRSCLDAIGVAPADIAGLPSTDDEFGRIKKIYFK